MLCSVIETQTDRSLILISHSMMSFTCGGPPEPHSFRALKHMKGQRSSSVEEGTSVLIPLTGFTSLTLTFTVNVPYQEPY